MYRDLIGTVPAPSADYYKIAFCREVENEKKNSPRSFTDFNLKRRLLKSQRPSLLINQSHKTPVRKQKSGMLRCSEIHPSIDSSNLREISSDPPPSNAPCQPTPIRDLPLLSSVPLAPRYLDNRLLIQLPRKWLHDYVFIDVERSCV